ncbi:MAG: hypothetical protein M0Q88_09745 [Bacilli bacterium]|nr:hypothetical protein [Bacilli bacterium]
MGDCSIIIENNSDVQIYEDKRIKDLENITIDKITSYMKKYNTGIEKARSANIGQLKKNRALKNIKYFVLSDEVLVDKAYSDIVPMDQIKSILILSDGFSRIYDVFNHYKTLSGLLNDIKNNSIEYVWNLICKYEKDDYDCIKYPRTKTSDDATAVYIEF